MKIAIVLLVCLLVSFSSVQGQEKMKWSTERCDNKNNGVFGRYPGVYTCSDFCKSSHYGGPLANFGYCTVNDQGVAYCKCGVW